MILVLWLHLMAAVVWIGGMVFLSLVLVPVMRGDGFSGERRALFQAVAYRFRGVVWASILILLITGPILLLWGNEWTTASSTWSTLLGVKLGLVAMLIGLTAIHDFWIGPRVLRAGSSSSATPGTAASTVIRLSPWIARLALLVGLAILGLGVALVKLS